MSRSTHKEREILKEQEEKGIKEQISNLQSNPQKKYTQPIKYSDVLKSKPPSQDVPLTSDPRSNLNVQQQQVPTKFESNPPKEDLSAENFSKQRENLFIKTSPSTEKNIVYVPKTNVDLSKESSNLSSQEKSESKASEKKEGDLALPKSGEMGSTEQTSSIAPPQTSVRESEAASSTFSQVPDINEEKIKEYLMNALAYLKEAEEKMAEKFAEARAKIMEMHPQEKLSHAVDVTKDKALSALAVTIEDAAIAKEGIKHTYEKVRDSVIHIAEKVSDAAKSNYDVLRVKIGELSHKTVEEYEIAKGKIGEYSNKAHQIYDSTKHAVQESEITHMAQDFYETTKHKVQESELAHKAQDILEATKQKIGEISEEVVDYLTKPTDELQEAAVRVRENLENERETKLRLEKLEREKYESFQDEQERKRLLKVEDENTRIKLLNEEAPK